MARTILVLVLVLAPAARAQHYLFPRPGEMSLTVAAGVPYLGVTEIATGITPRFSAGVLFAVADEIGVGIRPRVLLFDGETARVALTMPLVYYPPSWKRSGEDWLYTNPALRLELSVTPALRLYSGAGIVFAACTDSVSSLLHGRMPEDDGDKRMVGGIWPTVHLGGAYAVTPSLSVIFDGATVLGGITPRAEYARRIGIDMVAELGVSKTF